MKYENLKQLDKNFRFSVKDRPSDHSSDSDDSLESSPFTHKKEGAKSIRRMKKKKTSTCCPHQVQNLVILIAKKLIKAPPFLIKLL